MGSNPDRKATLAKIRATFVGNAEEHDALASLSGDYNAAYDRGFLAGQEAAKWQTETDQRLLKLAFAYQEGCPIDAHLHEWLLEPDCEYRVKYIGQRLHDMGITQGMMTAILHHYAEAKVAKDGGRQ